MQGEGQELDKVSYPGREKNRSWLTQNTLGHIFLYYSYQTEENSHLNAFGVNDYPPWAGIFCHLKSMNLD
jgi:hypothetical protein